MLLQYGDYENNMIIIVIKTKIYHSEADNGSYITKTGRFFR